MVAAVLCMTAIRRLSTIRFKPDWFHRLAGFSLDLMATAAISSIRFDYYKQVRPPSHRCCGESDDHLGGITHISHQS